MWSGKTGYWCVCLWVCVCVRVSLTWAVTGVQVMDHRRMVDHLHVLRRSYYVTDVIPGFWTVQNAHLVEICQHDEQLKRLRHCLHHRFSDTQRERDTASKWAKYVFLSHHSFIKLLSTTTAYLTRVCSVTPVACTNYKRFIELVQ